MSENINYNQEKILQKVATSISNVKQIPKWKSQLFSSFYLISSMVLLFVSSLFWMVFADQIKTNLIFASVVGFNISGWFWLWFPELPIFSSLLILALFFVYKIKDLPGYKYIDFVCVSLVVLFSFGSVFYVMTPVNALSSVNLIENIKLSANQSGYRLYWRDKHIEDLKNKNEFYGAVTAKKDNYISIDHAGVILDFQCNIQGCQNIKVGDLLWVKFNLLNGDKFVQSLEILK